MTTCSTCGCAPCACQSPAFLNQPRIVDPTISGGTWVGATLNGPTVNAGTLNGSNLVAVTIDCTSLGCTQPPGTCDASLATTDFVCAAVDVAISSANPAFCTAVTNCIGSGGVICAEVLNCINTIPGSISNVLAFDPAVFATELQVGVVRLATQAEVDGASCGLALEPCTLQLFWDGGGPNVLWTSFTNAVLAATAGDPGFCANVLACGVAPLASPTFTGNPLAPTPPALDSSTSIATTAFVQGEITTALTAAIDGANPTFCTAVGVCGYALLASPAFVGVPTAPTAAPGTNTTQLATTAFVQAALTGTTGIFFNSTAVPNVAAVETTAYLHNIAAGLLAANGDAIEFEAAGTLTASASVNKRIRLYFGATVVFDSGNLAITAGVDWHVRGSIVRTGAATEKVAATISFGDTTIQAIADYVAAAENTAVLQVVRMTFFGTLAADVVGEFFRDRYIAA